MDITPLHEGMNYVLYHIRQTQPVDDEEQGRVIEMDFCQGGKYSLEIIVDNIEECMMTISGEEDGKPFIFLGDVPCSVEHQMINMPDDIPDADAPDIWRRRFGEVVNELDRFRQENR